MTLSCHGLLDRHSNGTRSLTHLLTHSIPLKSNYTLYSYLPYLVLLLFKVPFAHVFGIFWRVLVRRILFSRHKRVASRRWVLYKWKYSNKHWQYHMQEMDLELLKGRWNNWAWIIAVYLDELCTFVPRCCDLMWRSGDRQSVRELSNCLTMGFSSAKSE